MDNDKCWDCNHPLLSQPCCYRHRVGECIFVTKKQLKDFEKEQGKKVLELRDKGFDIYFDLHTRQFVGKNLPEGINKNG